MEEKKVNSKLVLFTSILVLICLLLLNYFLSNNEDVGIWDYDNLTSGYSIMYSGEKVTDREVYYTLETVIQDYMKSYVKDTDNSDVVTYKDYYNSLSDNYKKHLGKNGYYEVAENFFTKFFSKKLDYETMQYFGNKHVIKNVYEVENSVYLCELETSNSEEAFIALQLLTDNTIYIYYIE